MIPAGLAMVITVVLGFSIPLLSTRYQLKLVDSELVAPDYYRYYHDLDGDGSSEIIDIFYNSSGNLSVKFLNIEEGTINQFNLPGTLLKIGRTLDLHDINGDGLCDIFICTQKGDSLYLSVIDDIYSHPTTFRKYALDPINRYNDYGDYRFIPGGIRDLNGDGNAEYVMAVNGGHALQPRRVYALDYMNDCLLRSPVSGAAIHSLDFFDLDGDGLDEVMMNTTATNNFSEHFPYMDTTTYLMVLDGDLSFYKPPRAVSQYLSWSEVQPFTHKGERFLLSYVRSTDSEHIHSILTIYNDSLRSLRTRDIHMMPREKFSFWSKPDSLGLEYLQILGKGKIYTMDFKLQFTDSVKSSMPVSGFYNPERFFNLDGTGGDEYVYIGENKIFVVREDLKHTAGLDLLWNERSPRTLVSSIQTGSGKPLLLVQLEREAFYLAYDRNAWFKFRYLVFPAVFLILFGLFYLLGSLQSHLIKRRYEKDKLISQLQLQAIKNQLDPHFTYNALNAVGSLIYKGEKELAYQYLKGLTDLLRLVSADASDVTWTLTDEISFVRKFLEIEKLRFSDRFEYSLEIEEALGALRVPKLSVLTFVENGIKHGLRHKKSNRELKVTAGVFEGGMRIAIADNGIGREAAAKNREEKAGNGIEMMKKYFKQFNTARGQRASFKMIDLYNEKNEPAGTLVEIYIV